jgi:hypothetical protein
MLFRSFSKFCPRSFLASAAPLAAANALVASAPLTATAARVRVGGQPAGELLTGGVVGLLHVVEGFDLLLQGRQPLAVDLRPRHLLLVVQVDRAPEAGQVGQRGTLPGLERDGLDVVPVLARVGVQHLGPADLRRTRRRLGELQLGDLARGGLQRVDLGVGLGLRRAARRDAEPLALLVGEPQVLVEVAAGDGGGVHREAVVDLLRLRHLRAGPSAAPRWRSSGAPPRPARKVSQPGLVTCNGGPATAPRCWWCSALRRSSSCRSERAGVRAGSGVRPVRRHVEGRLRRPGPSAAGGARRRGRACRPSSTRNTPG